jgi:hypothetical protein
MSGISRGGDYRTDKPTSIGDPALVQSWPFPEPEKKTAWKDEAPAKDTPVHLVDHELEKTKRKGKAIRDSMAAPGALGLAPALEAQRQKYGIPDGVHSRLPHRPVR